MTALGFLYPNKSPSVVASSVKLHSTDKQAEAQVQGYHKSEGKRKVRNHSVLLL